METIQLALLALQFGGWKWVNKNYCLTETSNAEQLLAEQFASRYKFRNNLAYSDNAELHPAAYSSTRSSGHAFKLPIFKNDFDKFSFFPRSIQEWNRLTRQVALAKSLKSFTTVFFDSRLFKSKRLWKRFQDFRQSYPAYHIWQYTLSRLPNSSKMAKCMKI